MRPFIDTFNNIHQAQTFVYNLTDATASQTAKNYDFVWGADVGTDPSMIAALRASNPNIVVLGNPEAERLAIVSFLVRHGARFLHYNYGMRTTVPPSSDSCFLFSVRDPQ